MPIFKLDPWFHATVFLAIVCILIPDLNRVDRYLGEKERESLSTVCMTRLLWQPLHQSQFGVLGR
jgi:hypothetical protein